MIKVIAHRGFSDKYPENTMLAFRKAVEVGSDGIELDVHLTKDGQLAVIHDEKIDRTTNGTGLVRDMTMDEIRKFDAGSGEVVPTLEEYLDFAMQHPIITNIELKNGIIWYDGMEEKVIQAIRDRKLEDKIIFSSFNHYSILKCKKLAPEIECGFLTGCWIAEAGAYTKKYGVEYLHPEFYNLTPEVCEEVKKNGIRVNTWTVNSSSDIKNAIAIGVNSIITNDPVLLRQLLEA